MDEECLPLKRVEHSLSQFSEVAIPHHLGLLRQHRANILNWLSNGEYKRVVSEQARAARVCGQLRALLTELDELRRRVAPSDVPRFDQLTRRARDDTLRAVADYFGDIEKNCRMLAETGRRRLGEAGVIDHIVQHPVRLCSNPPKMLSAPLKSSPVRISGEATRDCVSGSALSTDSVGVLVAGDSDRLGYNTIVGDSEPVGDNVNLGDNENEENIAAPLAQLRIDYNDQLLEREAVLAGWLRLQSELTELQQCWQQLTAVAVQQREQVETTSALVEEAAGNVDQARTHLALAEKLSGPGVCWGGAALGLLAGGPVGVAVGAKLGALAALAGSALGYLAARVATRRRAAQIDNEQRRKTD